MESVLSGSTLHRGEKRLSLRRWWRVGFPAIARQWRDSRGTRIFLITYSRIANRENLGANYPTVVGDTGVRGARLNPKPLTLDVTMAVSVLHVWLQFFLVI